MADQSHPALAVLRRVVTALQNEKEANNAWYRARDRMRMIAATPRRVQAEKKAYATWQAEGQEVRAALQAARDLLHEADHG